MRECDLEAVFGLDLVPDPDPDPDPDALFEPSFVPFDLDVLPSIVESPAVP
jgi:hypothetical protein